MQINKEKVAILMATYNGDKYIEEQIYSIYNQDDVSSILYISDDLSTDNTINIIENFRQKNKFDIQFSVNHNKYFKKKSSANNFYRLIIDSNIPNDIKWVAFSDQDDIWFNDHLKRAINCIKVNKYSGYSASVIAFWSNKKKIYIKKDGKQNKFNYLFESAGPGCTYVLPKSTFLLLQEHFRKNINILSNIDFHDWSIYAFVSSQNGYWFIDSNPALYYRQHSSNVFGAKIGINGIVLRLKLLTGKWYRGQVLAIADLVNKNELEIIKLYTRFNFIDKLYLAYYAFNMRRNLLDSFTLSLSILLSGKK
ncbi:glycosyltransferase [Prochlorococcus sp. MIT 1011]|uniref:glycosyltransferase n=1 Tax=Prochlorococcus sp. MIT 1011 TaxID=3082520 RepID=UPI0039B6919A